MSQQTSIRNFSIIAHIDHGKTTLTDRLLELTNTVETRLMKERYLDSHPVARQRGVTIKLAPVRMTFQLNASDYILNLIDTPGHIDFNYEVSRSLVCCEGAVLLVDATCGIQAQTLGNFRLAQKLGLKIIPVVNKIDLSLAQPEKVSRQLVEVLGFDKSEIIAVSAKTGENVEGVLKAVIKRIPPPSGKPNQPLRALVFDSFYHQHKGVVVYLRIVDGCLTFTPGKTQLKLLASQHTFEPQEIGYLAPQMKKTDCLANGEVGYIATGLKEISLCQIGDTITKMPNKKGETTIKPLPGYKEPKPMVFFDVYPVENQGFPLLKEAMEQLSLNDVALTFTPIGFPSLGKGFRIGFLGVFHALITQERLEQDFGLEIIMTSPSVEYQILTKKGSLEKIQSVSQLPPPAEIKEIREPWLELIIYTPTEYLGGVFSLLEATRGEFVDQHYYNGYVNITFHLPLIEFVKGFYNQLKSVSSGYASVDYRLLSFRAFEAVKLEVLVSQRKIEGLSLIVEREHGEQIAPKIAKKMKKVMPRQLFKVPIQVSLNGRIIARETIPALRKDVTAKLYGGDQTRKDKLLEKQKAGKKRLKAVGKVIVPQEAFMAILETR